MNKNPFFIAINPLNFLFSVMLFITTGLYAAEIKGDRSQLTSQEILYLRQLLTEKLKEKSIPADERQLILGARRGLKGKTPVNNRVERRAEIEEDLRNILRLSVAKDPERVSSRMDLARFYIYQDKPELAAQHLNKIEKEGERYLFKPLLLTYSYLRLGEYRQAEPNIKLLESAVSTLLPLRIQNMNFCTSIRGMGQYKPRADSVFKPEESTWIYFETVGGDFKKGEEEYSLNFMIGLAIRDDLYRTVWEKKEYCEFPPSYREPVRVVFGGMDLIIPGTMGKGKYNLVLTLTDKNSGKTASGTLPFTISDK